METFIINLYGGPCCGKSTIAAGLFYELKCRGIECEITGEYAKDKIWDLNPEILNDQVYIFGKQSHRIWRLSNKVNIIICDSPMLLSIIYSKEKSSSFEKFIVEKYNEYNNLNFLLKRNFYNDGYQENGRNKTLSESINIDDNIKEMFNKHSIEYIDICENDSKTMVNKILEYLTENNIIQNAGT